MAQQKRQAATLISRLRSMNVKEINWFCDLLIGAVFELFSHHSLGWISSHQVCQSLFTVNSMLLKNILNTIIVNCSIILFFHKNIAQLCVGGLGMLF